MLLFGIFSTIRNVSISTWRFTIGILALHQSSFVHRYGVVTEILGASLKWFSSVIWVYYRNDGGFTDVIRACVYNMNIGRVIGVTFLRDMLSKLLSRVLSLLSLEF